jgi:hypothetical protein
MSARDFGKARGLDNWFVVQVSKASTILELSTSAAFRELLASPSSYAVSTVGHPLVEI